MQGFTEGERNSEDNKSTGFKEIEIDDSHYIYIFGDRG